VGLEDIYNGREIEVTFSKQIICPHCRGSGAESDDDFRTCNKCRGKGHVIEKRQLIPGFIQQIQVE
jgi:DnaJ-related protein SCJ1